MPYKNIALACIYFLSLPSMAKSIYPDEFADKNPMARNTLESSHKISTCLASNGILLDIYGRNKKTDMLNAIIWAYLEEISNADEVQALLAGKIDTLRNNSPEYMTSQLADAGCKNLTTSLIKYYKIDKM